MNKAQATTLNRLNSASADAQATLKALRSLADQGVVAFAEGTRFPHSPSAVGRSAARVVEALTNVETLLEQATMLGVEDEDLLAAYRGKASYFIEDEG